MLLLFESANFDETHFDRPENFDAAREPNQHLAFGFGTRFCLGNQLARIEARLMFERVLQRLPDMTMASCRVGRRTSSPDSNRCRCGSRRLRKSPDIRRR